VGMFHRSYYYSLNVLSQVFLTRAFHKFEDQLRIVDDRIRVRNMVAIEPELLQDVIITCFASFITTTLASRSCPSISCRRSRQTHTHHSLAAERGCSDGAAFTFLFFALYLTMELSDSMALCISPSFP
jgi:hypothetical protein